MSDKVAFDVIQAWPAGACPLEVQIKCVEREIAMRKRVYPRFVTSGSMKPDAASREYWAMSAVLETLRKLAEAERLI